MPRIRIVDRNSGFADVPAMRLVDLPDEQRESQALSWSDDPALALVHLPRIQPEYPPTRDQQAVVVHADIGAPYVGLTEPALHLHRMGADDPARISAKASSCSCRMRPSAHTLLVGEHYRR